MGQVYAEFISDPDSHALVARDAANNNTVVGVLTLQLIRVGEALGGSNTKHPWDPDHSEELLRPAVKIHVEFEERTMGGRAHYVLELLGVDDANKGHGIATGFYLKLGLGFRVEREETWDASNPDVLLRLPANA